MTKITVEVEDRVDKAVGRAYPEAGRKQLGELFDDGVVRVNGKKAKKGDRVAVGDVIELSREPVSGEALRPVADPAVVLEILVERADLVAIAKPAGRVHYIRAHVVRNGEYLVAHPHLKQGSAMLSSLIGCNALVELPADATEIMPHSTQLAVLLEPV